MNERIERLLDNRGSNYIFPFFWLHGEDEATLREYMQKIEEANLKAVCVESRPHPDFCGPQWWRDMDIILDEARRRNMKVWILDDSHFPTGYANGAMEGQPDILCRQSLCCRVFDCKNLDVLHIGTEELNHPKPFEPNKFDYYIGEKNPRRFNDDRRLGIVAVNTDVVGAKKGMWLDLTHLVKEGTLDWVVEDGSWSVYVLYLSRNQGYHRSYINMMSRPSCQILINAVYEPHYERYREDFGKTIAGFFSDEPELGNGHLYAVDNYLGQTPDLPWSEELEALLKQRLGKRYLESLVLLWENGAPSEETARARYTYMDAVTTLVREDFSKQLGTWCREHGVSYIGHLIEDNNQHARTGSSLGHYFRGLAGQDMAGIDDIGNQVFPGGEDLDIEDERFPFKRRIGEFYHYMLGALAVSGAAIEPGKCGNAMCEIFGAYGWSEGVRLEKYLVDHFMVRGINHFVPHAFSPMAFPDPDCPPHFYAHGNNPQYRHFGSLMAYTNRICELIHDGCNTNAVAILYHGEGEWTGKYLFSHKIAHTLLDAQINYDYIPQDVFAFREDYRTIIKDGILKVNTQNYRIVFVPGLQYVTAAFAAAVNEMLLAGVKVCFVERYPEGICDQTEDKAKDDHALLAAMQNARLISLAEGPLEARSAGAAELSLSPMNHRVRYYHYEYNDGCGIYMFVNEGADIWKGTVVFNNKRYGYLYDAWENGIYPADFDVNGLKLTLEPLKSRILVLDNGFSKNMSFKPSPEKIIENSAVRTDLLNEGWKRSLCRSIAYPGFGEQKEICLPDCLADEEPLFSGLVRYENTFKVAAGQKVILEITDAHEGVEVFVNGQSQGIQIVPVYRYDLTSAVKTGENYLAIEVATTLEREMSQYPDQFGQTPVPSARSGITGVVKLHYIPCRAKCAHAQH